MSARRAGPARLLASLLLAGALALLSGSLGGGSASHGTAAFVGGPPAWGQSQGAPRGGRVALASMEKRKAGLSRRRKALALKKREVLLDGKEVLVDYKERLGPQESDVPFSAAKVTGDTLKVNFKSAFTGILRYQPGEGGKGAMVKDVGKPFFIGDMAGQAAEAGIKPGMVVKSVNDEEVSTETFGKIMDLIDDPALGGSGLAKPVAVPFSVTFVG